RLAGAGTGAGAGSHGRGPRRLDRAGGAGAAPRPAAGGALAAALGPLAARLPCHRQRGAARPAAPAPVVGQPDVSPAARRYLAAAARPGPGLRRLSSQLLWLQPGQRRGLVVVVDGALAQRAVRQPRLPAAVGAAV